MPSLLERPIVHYGVPLINASIIAAIGFTVFSGTERLVVLAIALVEVLVVPQVLKRAG
ncbi:hypothetical protein [Halorubrum sp. AS12]|uniref:hypothetical protein n=1 Tax=Halorubrum sp. AS12 TaxID=3409687 RepID=UPI003DA730F2